MKKFFVTLFFLAVSLIGRSQLFVAGSVSVNHLGGYSKTAYSENVIDKSKESGFSVAPAVGYMIPGKSYGGGLSLVYSYSVSKGNTLVDNVSEKKFANTFDFGPFFRYAYAKFEKITLYIDAKMPISVGRVKTKIGDESVMDGDKTFAIGGRLIPGLTYKFTPHILFTTEIGLFSLNYMHTKVTSPSGNIDVTSEFKLGANSRQIAAFGFVYLF